MESNNPLVSILIPNFNKALFLRETLDSVLAQTYTNWECIIVDDHSTDNSWEILEEYREKDARFKIYKRPDHLLKGGNGARNYAFELSTGEFVNWFDSDDLMNNGFIESKVRILFEKGTYDFVISDLKCFNNSIQDWFYYNSLNLSQESINFPLQALKGTFWIGTPLPLFRRNFIKNFKLFSEKLYRGQEAEFFNRILLSKPKFKFIPESVCYWRQSENSKTNKYLLSSLQQRSIISFPAHILIIKEFLSTGSIDLESKEYFNKQINFHLRYLPVFSKNYFRLFYFIYFEYKYFPWDFPFKILGRRVLNVENWK